MATVAWFFRDRGYDDPYITYRYTANIADGAGFVYNHGERVLSTTTPLYALLLAPFHAIGLPIPFVSNIISCLSLAFGGIALWGMGRAWKSPHAGWAGLLLYPAFPLLITTLGAETTFYVALILVGFWATAAKRYYVAAVLLALATLTRADGIVAVGVGGLYVLIAHRRIVPLSAIGLYTALLLPWFTFAWVYFGYPLPVTLAAKQQQGKMTISQSFLEGLIEQAHNYWKWHAPASHLYLLLLLIGILYIVLRKRYWLLPLGWSLLYTLAYTVLGVTSYFWYYAPVVVGLVVAVAAGYEAIVQMLARVMRGWKLHAIRLLLLIVLFYPQGMSIKTLQKWSDTRLEVYQEIGTWLNRNTPTDASVGSLEIGIIGYYAERRMIDFAGLLQPETAHHLTETTTYEDAAIWAYRHYRPEYLVLPDGMFPRFTQSPEFVQQCQQVTRFDTASHHIGIYACNER